MKDKENVLQEYLTKMNQVMKPLTNQKTKNQDLVQVQKLAVDRVTESGQDLEIGIGPETENDQDRDQEQDEEVNHVEVNHENDAVPYQNHVIVDVQDLEIVYVTDHVHTIDAILDLKDVPDLQQDDVHLVHLRKSELINLTVIGQKVEVRQTHLSKGKRK